MSTKKTKREPKAKPAPSEGRKPTLTPFIDGAFDIHAEHKGKEFTARVNADGTITYDGGTYGSTAKPQHPGGVAGGNRGPVNARPPYAESPAEFSAGSGF